MSGEQPPLRAPGEAGDPATAPAALRAGRGPRLDRRRLVSGLMTTLTALCALVAVTLLVVILGYIVYQGVTSINLQFLTDTPKPVGEGGGIGHAIVGTLILLGLASIIGLPLGIAAGIYLAEFGGGWFGRTVRFVTDTLTGVPSIVVGVFVYTLIVLPMKHYSALAGGVARRHPRTHARR